MADQEVTLRIPSPAKFTRLAASMGDDDFSFGRVKVQRDKPKYELPAPTEEEPDNVVIAAGFNAVVLVAKQNFYRSEEDKENGVEAKEKRELYIIRTDQVIPELMYVNPTSLNNWKKLAKDVRDAGESYFYVIVHFGAESVVSKTKGYKWNKITFDIVRPCTEAERVHIDALRELTESRVKTWVNQDELDSAEAEVLGMPAPRHAAAAPAPVAPVGKLSEARPAPKPSASAGLNDDEEDGGMFSEAAQTAQAAKATPSRKKSEAPKPAAAPVKPGYPSLGTDDDDDESPVAPPVRALANLDDED